MADWGCRCGQEQAGKEAGRLGLILRQWGAMECGRQKSDGVLSVLIIRITQRLLKAQPSGPALDL
jgi:hypothetical protein